MDSSAFEQRLKDVAARVESTLERLLAADPLPGEVARPTRLLAAMRHGALAGGKRLRPFLTIATAEALGAGGEGPLRAGCAIELVHCYSLVHDDLPAMDDDDLRRGRPTVHKAFDEATALLAGDALLTHAFALLAEAYASRPILA
ncbi:MAG TPA: polyprenyl synthetase family protein, partial [Roseiarcus sp.]|nr:polyprenyl synthetase family protein [Roseiarcus sp.]